MWLWTYKYAVYVHICARVVLMCVSTIMCNQPGLIKDENCFLIRSNAGPSIWLSCTSCCYDNRIFESIHWMFFCTQLTFIDLPASFPSLSLRTNRLFNLLTPWYGSCCWHGIKYPDIPPCLISAHRTQHVGRQCTWNKENSATAMYF